MEHDYITLPKPHDTHAMSGSELFEYFVKNPTAVNTYLTEVSQRQYLYWDKAQYRQPIDGLSAADSFRLAKNMRRVSARPLPVRAVDGTYFSWMRQDKIDRLLRKIDMYAGGQLLTDSSLFSGQSGKQQYITRGIIEEAIASSQLEGADTSRRYAKKMIAENIKPRNSSDWMILNNHALLNKIESDYKSQPLSLPLLLELHADLTRNTLKDGDVGRLRNDADNIVVLYKERIAHTPPNEAFLHRELEALIHYVNDDNEDNFVHPVIKAIILHFWIGYLHPFVDGNGRIARTLFYWYMLRHDYWAFTYLPISAAIKRAPRQYAYAYIYSEQDDYDFTYFLDYHLSKIIDAIDDFIHFLDRTKRENSEVCKKLLTTCNLNDRQRQIVLYLLSDVAHYTSVTSHQTLSGVARPTASRDIKQLHEAGLLVARRKGNTIQYFASDTLRQLSM
ncbi:MAG: Fic family protein [Candidatus Saccharibacteria bacterium]|nr:Fic family protein [Candidatus Saccharibacteria bacterium]